MLSSSLLATPFSSLLALLALLIIQSGATEFPAPVEVDLVFPRNDTFTPIQDLPVVFALQNPALAVILQLSISWIIKPVNSNSGSFDYGFFHAITIPNTAHGNETLASNNPFIASQFTTALLGNERTWNFSYTVNWTSCSTLLTSDANLTGLAYTSQNSFEKYLIFSTKNDTQTPDLVAATSEGQCANTQSTTLAVTGTEDITPSCSSISCPSTCANTTDNVTLTPNPCAVSLNTSEVAYLQEHSQTIVCKNVSSVFPPTEQSVSRLCSVASILDTTGNDGSQANKLSMWLLLSMLGVACAALL